MGAGQVLDPRGGPDGSPLALPQPPDVSIEVSANYSHPVAADVCSRMLTYAMAQPPDVSIEVSGNYSHPVGADVCARMLTYAQVC